MKAAGYNLKLKDGLYRFHFKNGAYRTVKVIKDKRYIITWSQIKESVETIPLLHIDENPLIVESLECSVEEYKSWIEKTSRERQIGIINEGR